MPAKRSQADDLQKKSESSEKVTQTAWGLSYQDQEITAYEIYFWMHVQEPERFSTFWETYNAQIG